MPILRNQHGVLVHVTGLATRLGGPSATEWNLRRLLPRSLFSFPQPLSLAFITGSSSQAYTISIGNYGPGRESTRL